MTVDQSFGAVLVGGSETILRLAAQSHEQVTGLLDLEQTWCPLVICLARLTARLVTDPRTIGESTAYVLILMFVQHSDGSHSDRVGNNVLLVPGSPDRRRTRQPRPNRRNPYPFRVRDGFLVHLYLIRIVDDDVELSEPSIVDHERCRLLRAVFQVAMLIHVGDGLPVTRVPQQLYGVRNDSLVRVDVSLATGRGHCIAEPPEAWNRIVLDDLVDERHFESVPTNIRRGVVMMPCSSAYRRMNGTRSSFLNTGCISAKCSSNASGT